MVMPWFLPLALGIGAIGSRTFWEYQRDPGKARQRGGAWLLLFMGWFPLLAWILSHYVPQC